MPEFSSSQPQELPPLTVMAFVDVGYLTAGARKRLNLESTPRIDGDELTLWASFALRGSRRVELIRTYVYDAQYPGHASEYSDQREYFDTLGAQAGIRLRLGHLVQRSPGSRRATWQQKGVDSLMVLDLVRLAQLRAFDVALVVAGDRDLAEALRVIADDHARRVYLFSVEGSAPAKELVQAADARGVIDDPWLLGVIGRRHPPRQRDAVPGERGAPTPE
jgi:uncharacterized LabA/DUF88 family protein